MDNVEEVAPREIRVEEVDKYWATSTKLIGQIMVVDKDVVGIFIIYPIRATSQMSAYNKNLKKELTKVAENMYIAERQLEQMKTLHVSNILDIHARWKVHV